MPRRFQEYPSKNALRTGGKGRIFSLRLPVKADMETLIGGGCAPLAKAAAEGTQALIVENIIMDVDK